jgi:RimJ/RimL family protein N-acetyltransferase
MSGPDRPSIRLRPYGAGDLWLQRRFLGDPAMTEHLGGPESDEQIVHRHERYLAMTDPAVGAMFIAELGPDWRPVGSVGYWEHAQDDGTVVWETGWFVLPEVHGRGIATAATLLAIDAAWAAVARPMHAYPSVANIASNALARKLGMRLLGPREFEYPKGHWMTCNDWVIDPPEHATARMTPSGQGAADDVTATSTPHDRNSLPTVGGRPRSLRAPDSTSRRLTPRGPDQARRPSGVQAGQTPSSPGGPTAWASLPSGRTSHSSQRSTASVW